MIQDIVNDPGNLLFVGIFLGVLVAWIGLHQVFSPRETGDEARNRRMRMVAKGLTTEERLRLLKPEIGGGVLSGLPGLKGLPVLLRQSGAVIGADAFLLRCGLAALVLVGAGSAFFAPLAAIAGSMALAFGLPLAVVASRRKARMAKLVRQLPDALDLLARGLKVGHPLNASIAAVATDLPDPIASEFGIVLDQISYGDELVDAFAEFADRVQQEDVRYMSVAIAIQHGTGGDLAAVLNTMAGVIRDRLSMRKRILAISAEGRMTAWFLSALPVFIFVVSTITAPGYYGDVVDKPLFQPFAIVIGALVVGNFLLMQKIVNFKF